MLSLIYNNKKSSLRNNYKRMFLVFFNNRNLFNHRVLAIKMHKIYHDFSNGVIKEIFILRHQNQCNPRNWSGFFVLIIRSFVDLGSEGVSYLCPKVWEIIPAHKNESDTKDKLKIDTKKRKPECCLYRL